MDFTLTDGTRVRIRYIRPTDRDRLATAHGRLSAETIHKRYLAAKPRLTAAELAYLTEVDGRNHVAVVAVLADSPDEIVAVGRFVRLQDEPDAAEVAIVVGDCHQGHGLGRQLGAVLADEALTRGIKRFRASMLAENVPAHRLFSAMTQRLESRAGGVDELVLELAA
ncbi:MAG: hypothetical protein QOI98_1205 [Solirubrobacteraceae bacterium]|nr:hypothetical protein [Solirubrobacteraceae bacterium]